MKSGYGLETEAEIRALEVARDLDDRGDVTSGTFSVWRVENAAFSDVATITFP